MIYTNDSLIEKQEASKTGNINQEDIKLHEDEISLMEYWNTVWRNKYLISMLFIASLTMAFVISFLLPKFYSTETVIITTGPESGGLGAALSSLPLAGAFGSLTGMQTPAEKIIIILKSRTLAEAVVKKFDLVRVFFCRDWDPVKGAWKKPYNHPVMEDAVKKLRMKVSKFTKGKEGAITISVEWKDPRLAAEIANYYVTALTGFLNEKSMNVTIQVVDRAVPPERKSWPQTGQNMILAGVASLFIGVFSAFLLEYISKHRK